MTQKNTPRAPGHQCLDQKPAGVLFTVNVQMATSRATQNIPEQGPQQHLCLGLVVFPIVQHDRCGYSHSAKVLRKPQVREVRVLENSNKRRDAASEGRMLLRDASPARKPRRTATSTSSEGSKDRKIPAPSDLGVTWLVSPRPTTYRDLQPGHPERRSRSMV